jgi:hypothetical protein
MLLSGSELSEMSVFVLSLPGLIISSGDIIPESPSRREKYNISLIEKLADSLVRKKE